MTAASRLVACLVASLALAQGCTSTPGTATRPPSPGATPAAQFDRALIAKGRSLAAIGNCETCHTAHGGKLYAGGFPLKTPFGTVYGTNITPDRETGIGEWTEADFKRAMREGLDREGQHLYPAFPYDHFTRLTDADIAALYAFIMTREPVASRPPANRVAVPRAFVAIWKRLYFDREPFRADPSHDGIWNRGAYLADALAHCGACHTPRNSLGAEKRRETFSGGEAGGWHAPALDASSPSPVPWDASSLFGYLRSGLADGHAMTAGPMKPVVTNLSKAPEDEVRAIAAYIAAIDERPAAERQAQSRSALAAPPSMPPSPQDDRALRNGASIYAGACGDCHDRGRAAEGGALPLPLATGLTIPTPRNLIHIVRDGIIPDEHEARPWMPHFSGALDDAQLADLLAYLRALSGKPPWSDVAGEVRKTREQHE